MKILKDEGGQIVPTEKLDMMVIGAITIIVVVAMIMKVVSIDDIIKLVVAGFIGFMGRGLLQNATSNNESADPGSTDNQEQPQD